MNTRSEDLQSEAMLISGFVIHHCLIVRMKMKTHPCSSTNIGGLGRGAML